MREFISRVSLRMRWRNEYCRVQESPELAEKLSRNGLRRARDFSWSEHVERLVVLAQELASPERKRN